MSSNSNWRAGEVGPALNCFRAVAAALVAALPTRLLGARTELSARIGLIKLAGDNVLAASNGRICEFRCLEFFPESLA